MRIFCTSIFWLYSVLLLARVINIVTGNYNKPVPLGVYCADTVITATIMIWAGFTLWG